MTTPNFGLPFPVLGDRPNGPAAFQALADATDAALQTHELRLDELSLQTGVWDFGTLAPGTGGAYWKTYPKVFAAPPALSLTLETSDKFFTFSINTTLGNGSEVWIQNIGTGQGICRLRYVAIGRLA
jgi:hypothetical protein